MIQLQRPLFIKHLLHARSDANLQRRMVSFYPQNDCLHLPAPQADPETRPWGQLLIWRLSQEEQVKGGGQLGAGEVG